MEIKGIIFDMDGVILDSMDMWRGVLPSLANELNISPDDEDKRKMQAMGLEQSADYLVNRYALDRRPESLVDLMTEWINDYYQSHARLLPGVADAMPIFRSRRKKVCIATATPKPLAKAALDRNDVYEYFRHIITTGEVGASKQEPDIFEQALLMLKDDGKSTVPSKEETLVVDDAQVALITAKNAGFKVAGVYEGPNKESIDEIADILDFRIHSIVELLELID